MKRVIFRKSQEQSGDANCLEVGGVWQKSSFSANTSCVEAVHSVDGHIYMRDTDDPSVVIKVREESFLAFIRAVKTGEFDIAGATAEENGNPVEATVTPASLG